MDRKGGERGRNKERKEVICLSSCHLVVLSSCRLVVLSSCLVRELPCASEHQSVFHPRDPAGIVLTLPPRYTGCGLD
jgi:hypothetical protein